MKNESNLSAYLLLVGVIFAWGLNWPVLKTVIHVISPFWLTPMRMLLGASCLFIVLAYQRRVCWPAKQEWGLVFVVGALQMGLYTLFVTLGLRYIDAGRSAILAYTTPLWVLPLAIGFLGEKLTKLKLMGFLLGVVGVLLLFNPVTFDWHDKLAVIGSSYLMSASLLWAVAIIYIRRSTWVHTPFQLAPWQMLMSMVVLLPLALIADPHPDIVWGFTAAWTLTYIVFLSTAFAYWASVEVSKRLPATTTSLGFQAVPVVGMFSSAFFLHEHITLMRSFALITILVGLILVIYGETKRKRNDAITK